MTTTLTVRRVLLAQGAYYLVGGIWPVVHLRSFEAVTGPKHDGWLVRTVGGLIAVIGASLIAGARGQPSRALQILGIGSAAVLGGIDVVYVARGRISAIYLADAVVAAGAVAGWLAARRR
jgi:hypothetical protein